MGPVWSLRVLPYLLLIFSWLDKVPVKSYRRASKLSEILSYKYRVPLYCHNSFETIQCFEKCKDNARILESVESIKTLEDHEKSRDEIVRIALDIENEEKKRADSHPTLDARPGRSIPCENKCETDPLYWSCVEDCDEQDHTLLWKSRCFDTEGNGHCDETDANYLADPICQACLVNATKERLKHSCEIAYLPEQTTSDMNLCEQISFCDEKAGQDDHFDNIASAIQKCTSKDDTNLEKAEFCVNDIIMFAQRECCYSEIINKAYEIDVKATDPAIKMGNLRKLDERCMKILSPRLCREKCLIYKSESIKFCVEEECSFYHSTSDSYCSHCDQSTQAYTEFNKDKMCVEKCNDEASLIPCVKACLPYGPLGSSDIPEYLIDNCHNKQYLSNFSYYVMGQKDKKKEYWAESIDTIIPLFSDWTSRHKLPFECSSTGGLCEGEDRNILTIDEVKGLCKQNPFRTIDLLACSLILGGEDRISILNTLASDSPDPEITKCKLNYQNYEKTQMILYKMIFDHEEENTCTHKYCQGSKEEEHPNAVANMKCQIYDCQSVGKSPYCKPAVDGYIIDLEQYGTCWWKADFSKWETPYRLWSNYFNELHPAEIVEKLEYPNTMEILSDAMFEGKRSYYTFPYFVIIRSVCNHGYYTDENYKYFSTGNSPVVEMSYGSPTNRHKPRKLFQGVFKTALIDLEISDNDDKVLVPVNPKQIPGIPCPENICYPAFAAPLMFISVPTFQLTVLDQDTVSLLSRKVYVSQFHTRVAAGRGDIYDPGERDTATEFPIPTSKVPAHPGHLFPKERATFAVDSELNYHQSCFANSNNKKSSDDYKRRKCPELEHTLDDFDNPYDLKLFAPLDPEDIFRSQYTHGTAPTQAIAGFYDPKYVVIGDADMNNVQIVDWSKLLIKLEVNQSLISCRQPAFRNREYDKPIYSQLDRSDKTYPMNFFRKRYASKPYYTKPNSKQQDYADTAIFEAIGLEDRLLLITSKGLVPFYGHSNATVYKDKALEYRNNEILNKCFKIVRILPAAQPNSDLIVGITYDYNANSIKYDNVANTVEVAQEIWIGKFTEAGEDIQWNEIKSRPKDSMYFEDPIGWQNDKGTQKMQTVALPPYKDQGLSQSMREANPRSQIEAICYKAFRTIINKDIKPTAQGKIRLKSDKVRLVDSDRWCEAMDATPVQLKENAIQVLVRMRTLKNDDDSEVYFYIVATHLFNPLNVDVEWVIDTVIPRYPCIDEHREAVTHVNSFDERYFIGMHEKGSEIQMGCYKAYEDHLDFHIFLHGMTYPRALSNHLFLYGSRLLQSINNGRNFMLLKGFPQRFHDFKEFESGNGASGGSGDTDQIKKNRPVHRIVKMAFDDGGHYAFLTNKLELWFGSTGSFYQIRLRPSPLQSMTPVGLSQVRNVDDGVPFAVDFDSNNKLYEMVAIRGKGGHIVKIMKRPVKEWTLLRIKTVLEKFEETSRKLYQLRKAAGSLIKKLQKPFNYDIAEWSTFCGYVSPSLQQNFSKPNSRKQGTYFPHPEQHLLKLGKTHKEASLMAFQAITFTIVWESYLNPPARYYAGKDKDPFVSWVVNKRFEAFATMKTTLFSQAEPPLQHTILIQPSKFKRIILTKHHTNLIRMYSLDYNITAELRLEFSIRNDHAVLNTKFEEDQINSIELNVENSNGSVIQINTEKEVRTHQAAVLFIIRMSVKKTSRLSQTLSGENTIPVPVTFHLIGAFGKCILNEPAGIIGDKIESVAMVGCPANRDFVFDWNATLRSIRLRSDRANLNDAEYRHGIGTNCPHNEYICIFARSPAVLYFEIFDRTKERHLPYTGKYIMRIIGGGKSRDTIRRYSQEEIDAFNIVGISDSSLIWNEWDPINHQKIDHGSEQILTSDGEKIGRKDSRESILTSGVSLVSWVCHTLSPCARISPTSDFEVVFWFRIFITNRDVDSDTLCLYEKEFDVMLYGFPPSPEFQLLATLGFCFVLLGILYILYLCSRQEARLWIATKLGVKNWYFIIRDAIPKKLRYYELPLPEEAERTEKAKHFYGYGSEVSSHEASMTSIEMEGSFDDGEHSKKSSNSTFESIATSNADSSQILPKTKKLHTTAKQIVYDQILARRLNSIVERNRALRTNLIKKASIHQSPDEFEQELNFQRQFGRTVSQESVFTPPMPKDRKRGIDSFL